MRGRFITLEGIEGSGKSTQVRRLVARLEAHGHEVVATREPGGTPAADAMRQLLLDNAHAGLPAEAEMLLFAAARCDHVRRLVLPALERGAHVVCDRFSDSTRAYQGGARGLSASMVEAVDLIARGTLIPDVTLLLDLPAEEGLARARRRPGAASAPGGSDRFESEDLAFHRKVRSAFLRIAGEDPHRVWVIDASADVEAVADAVDVVIRRTLPDLLGGPEPRQAGT